MHPGELTLLRVIGQGRWSIRFHEHATHFASCCSATVQTDHQHSTLSYPGTGTHPAEQSTGQRCPDYSDVHDRSPFLMHRLSPAFFFLPSPSSSPARAELGYVRLHNPIETDPAAILPAIPTPRLHTVQQVGASVSAINNFELCQDIPPLE